MIKTENQIWADLKSLITQGLAKFGLEGWQIRQLQQPVKITTLQPTVFMASSIRRASLAIFRYRALAAGVELRRATGRKSVSKSAH